jgi:hypothetical protein
MPRSSQAKIIKVWEDIFFSFISRQTLVGIGLLIVEVSR